MLTFPTSPSEEDFASPGPSGLSVADCEEVDDEGVGDVVMEEEALMAWEEEGTSDDETSDEAFEEVFTSPRTVSKGSSRIGGGMYQ